MDEDEFFGDDAQARVLYRRVKAAVEAIGPADIRISESQIAFRRAHPFAAVWPPRRYLKGPTAPLVLSVYLRRRDASETWKEVVEPRPGRFTHHRELWSEDDIGVELSAVLAEAWRGAG